MRGTTLGLVLAAAMLAGCSGGGSSAVPAGTGGTTGGSTTQSETAIATANAVGAPMSNLADYNNATASLQSNARSAQSVQLGVCQATPGGGSYEFFSPDVNHDANSTEQQYFYDTSCAQLARDVVRVWTSSGASSETVNRTAKIYARGNATPIAVRTDAETIADAAFDQYGFAIPADGFARSDSGTLQYAGTNAVTSGDELVVSASSGSSQSFCGDAAGFNVNGIPALNETFGWNGGVLSGGTRTVNADGSVTWTATHAGSTYKGAIGALSIATGTPNTSCPIATPAFTLAGGTSLGAYTIPATATYKSGILIGLTIANATLASGATLNVTTNASVSPTSSGFITGTVSNAATQIATFSVDAYGDGTLTVSANGAQYVITDWHVVR